MSAQYIKAAEIFARKSKSVQIQKLGKNHNYSEISGIDKNHKTVN